MNARVLCHRSYRKTRVFDIRRGGRLVHFPMCFPSTIYLYRERKKGPTTHIFFLPPTSFFWPSFAPLFVVSLLTLSHSHYVLSWGVHLDDAGGRGGAGEMVRLQCTAIWKEISENLTSHSHSPGIFQMHLAHWVFCVQNVCKYSSYARSRIREFVIPVWCFWCVPDWLTPLLLAASSIQQTRLPQWIWCVCCAEQMSS